MKRKEFRPHELSTKAFEEYSGSTRDFWEDPTGAYWMGARGDEEFIGSIAEVNEMLEEFYAE